LCFSQRLKNDTPVQAAAQATTVEALGFLEYDIQLPTRIRLVPNDEDLTGVVFLASVSVWDTPVDSPETRRNVID
jgi:hypothetical protein